MPKKQLKGKVVSDKMDKTVIVEVRTVKTHPRYKGRYMRDRRYKAHDDNNQFKLGDEVVIEECRPLSKDKRWRVKRAVSESAREDSVAVKRAEPKGEASSG